VNDREAGVHDIFVRSERPMEGPMGIDPAWHL